MAIADRRGEEKKATVTILVQECGQRCGFCRFRHAGSYFGVDRCKAYGSIELEPDNAEMQIDGHCGVYFRCQECLETNP